MLPILPKFIDNNEFRIDGDIDDDDDDGRIVGGGIFYVKIEYIKEKMGLIENNPKSKKNKSRGRMEEGEDEEKLRLMRHCCLCYMAIL